MTSSAGMAGPHDSGTAAQFGGSARVLHDFSIAQRDAGDKLAGLAGRGRSRPVLNGSVHVQRRARASAQMRPARRSSQTATADRVHHRRSTAVEVGFEPTEGLPLHTLSRRAPSATRRLHRSRAYPSGWHSRTGGLHRSSGRLPGLSPATQLAQATEEVPKQRGALVAEHVGQNLDWRAQPGVVQEVPD